MKFTVLGSGSTGNAVLISSEKTNVLVDAGLSAKEITRRLGQVGVDRKDIDAILVTHEHGDHIGGMRVLLQSVDCPVYISEITEDAYYDTRAGGTNGDSESSKRRAVLKDRAVAIKSNAEFRIGDIDFEPFSVPHDAVDNFGFVATHDGVRVATLMDFGHMSDAVKAALCGCDAIIIESNHSRDMLRTCHVYTWDLKQRIMSRVGHLSNEDLADWLQVEFDGKARHVVLAHLSQRANDPHLARIMAETALKMRPPLFRAETRVSLSSHLQPTEWFTF
ncbi:MAG TPA: MBL fold metallo-hydrolase [Pyrinomonadaceae bacterium]|jgi:phosphoribosyl 1,2-cyclic phosphodiesterase|nr:MBL fold metallo-hydrolase [Pyrinomonadaceae bacterium]